MSFDIRIIKGDIGINNDGSLNLVTGNSKIRQDIIKIMLTPIGDNKFHPTYGSETGVLQIGSVPDQSITESDLTSSAENAVRKLMLLQREQAKRQFLSPAEVIADIISVSVQRDQVDQRLYNIFISILTEKLETITESITVRIF